jgi:arsenite-transporting ATPase
MRTLLFTGKGGVGKTTVAAATAVRCAAAGKRTLVISTDPAHSLADAFDVGLETEPREIATDLWGQQLDAQDRMEESWAEIKDFLTDVFDWAGLDAVEAEELSVLPGLDEVFALTDIKTYADSGEWDVLIVDCAPTAETIRLLSLPDILSWYMDRVFPIGRRVNRIVGPVLSRLSSMPVAGDDVFRTTSRFYDRLDGVKAILTDPEHASIRLVVNPEKMVIAEARRTYTYLSLFGYRVDAVVANRLLPDDITDPWFDRWKQAQTEQMQVIEEGFAPLPVLRSELLATEPIGCDRLAALAAALYADTEPTEVLHHGEPLRITKDDTGYELSLELPFADHDDLDVGRHGDELLVRIGPYRRAIALPDSLRRRSVVGARFRDGVLRVAFDADRRRDAAGRGGGRR